jgi:MFS family permease
VQPSAAAGGMGLAVVLGLLAGFAAVGSSGAAVVLPSLADAMGITTATSAWAISGFSLTYGVAMAVHGRLADLFGLRLPFTAGAVLMATGALLAAGAPSFGVLMVGRVLQGMGGAAIPVLGMAVLSARYSGLRRTRALGLATGVSAAGACIGPLVGGVLDGLLSWRAAIALPALGLALVPLVWRRIPTDGTGARLDIVGAGLVAAAATGVVLLIQSVSTGGAVAATGAVLLVVGLPGAVAWVRRAPDGFLPRAVVTDGSVVRSALAATAVPIAWFALLVAVPIALSARGWEPLQIGLALLPSVLCGLAAPRLTAPLLVRFGPARSLSGTGVTAAVALVVASAGAAWDVPALLVLGVMLVTTAFGLCQPAMVAAINDAVSADVRGVALGIAIMTFFVAGGIGSAVIGGFGDVVGVAASLAWLAVVPLLAASLVWPRKQTRSPDPLSA